MATDLRTRISEAVDRTLQPEGIGLGQVLLGKVTDAVMAVVDTPHVVEFTDRSWFIEHSISCRDTGMRHCEIHQRVAALCRTADVAPWAIGRYTARMVDDDADGRLLDLQPEA